MLYKIIVNNVFKNLNSGVKPNVNTTYLNYVREKNYLFLKELKYNPNLSEKMFSTKPLEIFDSKRMWKLHYSLTEHFNHYLSSDVVDYTKYEHVFYVSSFNTKVVTVLGYNNIGTTPGLMSNNQKLLGHTSDSNILFSLLREDEGVRSCLEELQFHPFFYDYALANNFALQEVKLGNDVIPLWDLNKVSNMDYFESLQRINPVSGLMPQHCPDYGDFFLHLLLSELKWHRHFYSEVYTYPTNNDIELTSLTVFEVNNIITEVLTLV